jgi:hypothetical protein
MIERYTIKFGSAVSQKELEKALHSEGGVTPDDYADKLTKMKARIEFIGGFDDVKKIAALLKDMAKK